MTTNTPTWPPPKQIRFQCPDCEWTTCSAQSPDLNRANSPTGGGQAEVRKIKCDGCGLETILAIRKDGWVSTFGPHWMETLGERMVSYEGWEPSSWV